MSYKKVFAALDAGPSQREVTERAMKVAANNGAELVLGHIVDAVISEASIEDMDALAEVVRKDVEADIVDLLEEAQSHGKIPSVSLIVSVGTLPDSLGTMIEEVQPDLVICCNRGLSGFKYAFIGSTSTYLTRNLECDVLVVHKR